MQLGLSDMFSGKRVSTRVPCTTPDAVRQSKAVALLRRYGCSVAAFLFVLCLIPKAPSFGLVQRMAIGIVWLMGFATQGFYLAHAIQKEEWVVDYRERHRWLGVLKFVYCYFFAYVVLSLLGAEGRIYVMSLVLGVFWWVLYEEHMTVMRCTPTHAEMVSASFLGAVICHIQVISSWVRQAYREWAGFGIGLLLARLIWPSLFASFGSAILVIVEMAVMTFLWMSGWTAFYENLHSRFDYGAGSEDAALQRTWLSIESTDPIIKMYGLGHATWVVEVGLALAPKYNAALFEESAGEEYWDMCAKACCQEIKSMCSIIVAIMGSISDINLPLLPASGNTMYLTVKKIQNKYMLLRSCLGFMMAMVRASGQRDSSGKRKSVGTCLEMVITNIFEGHCFICRVAQSSGTIVATWLPWKEIWCLKPLQMEFEMAGMTAWRMNESRVTSLVKQPNHIQEAALKKHVAQFIQKK